MQTIRLYGVLGAKFGRVHRMAVSSMSEAVRALSSQLPGFERFLTESKDKGLGYAVFYGTQNLTQDQLRFPCGERDIRIAPMVIGAKNGGLFNIIFGGILIVAGLLLAPTGIGFALLNLGMSMVLGGVVQLLAPSPKGRGAKDKPENEPSDVFNGPVNTQAQGNCVPVLYGKMYTGSAVASAGISAKDHSIIPANSAPVGSGGRGGGGIGGLIGAVLEAAEG